MENLIIYSIIFIIVLIGLILLYISINPVEIKEKPLEIKKNEKFIGTTTDVAQTFDISIIEGREGSHYTITNIGTEKCIVFKQNCRISFERNLENCKILVVGGGGGGGARHGGGGGAGAVIYLQNQTLISGIYNIIIGTGGAAVNVGGGANPGASGGNNGNDTSISLNSTNIYLAKGGGGGGGGGTTLGVSGGSSGGTNGGTRSLSNPVLTTNIPTGAYGNLGGRGSIAGGNEVYSGGGGGGAGGIGGDANQTYVYGTGGNGGNGTQINITGNNIYYGGGGGGGISINGNTAGIGGLGGGGAGSKGAVKATNGTANTGGGGGGAGFHPAGNNQGESGAGGSGVVIIRYRPVVINPDPSQGRVASSLDLNTITDPDATAFKAVLNKSVNDSSFGTVSNRMQSTNGFFQTARTYSRISSLNPQLDFTIFYSSYDTTATTGNFEPTPAFLFGTPAFEPPVTYNYSYFAPRRYYSSNGDFVDRNGLDINISTNGVVYNNRTLAISQNSSNLPTDNLRSLRGEYVGIKCPTPCNLIAYSFTANLAFENQAPGAWVLLGRNSATVETQQMPYRLLDHSRIEEGGFVRQDWTIYQNSEQKKMVYLLRNTESYDEYLFVFPKLASTDIRANVNYGHQLIFKEIKLYSTVPRTVETQF